MKQITWGNAVLMMTTNHVSVRKTAAEIGLSPTTYYRITKEGYMPDLRTTYKIMAWLGVDFIVIERPKP